jgi:superfamily II DNA or RNA helicase
MGVALIAAMSMAAGRIPPGTRVRARGDDWTVLSSTPHDGCESVRLEGAGTANRGLTRTLLRPFDRVVQLQADARTRAVNRRRWNRSVAQALLSAHPFGSLHAAAGAAFDVLPYQLEPALAMLRHGRLRLLLADEVGLGKTVQAAIIINELAARLAELRALVIAPAGLREQWRAELLDRFHLASTRADTAWLMASERRLPRDVNPWSLPAIYVTSVDLVKRPEVLRALDHLTWDLVVVDEAHNATAGTARLGAVRALASRARRVLLLTATPPDSEPSDMAALCDAGRAATEAPITIFRRSRVDAGLTSRRKSVLLPIGLSRRERELHRELDRYTLLVWRAAGRRGDPRARLAAVILRKRALSSAGSLARTVWRRLELLAPGAVRREEQLLLPLRDEDPLADEPPDAAIGAAGLADAGFERECLERIRDLADRAATRESKLCALRRLLRRVREPVIVFTEYRDTLRLIAAGLPATRAPLLLHGGLTPRERDAVQRAFTSSGDLLLATDAASEGLNLHHRCRVVVHFELPWTLTRLEQRTGRVDRIGQSHRVHEIVLLAGHTAERLVLAPLVRRMRIAGSRGGRRWSAPGESAVAAAVLDGLELRVEASDPAAPSRTMELAAETEHECRRVQLHRDLGAGIGRLPSAPAGAGTWIHVRRARHTLTVVVSLALRDASERVVHHEIVPLTVRLRHGPGSVRARDAVAWAAQLLQHGTDAILTVAAAATAESRRRVLSLVDDHADRLLDRERQIIEMAQPRQVALQTGLFDRRAVRHLQSRHEAATRLGVEQGDREGSLVPVSALRCDVRILAIRS